MDMNANPLRGWQVDRAAIRHGLPLIHWNESCIA